MEDYNLEELVEQIFFHLERPSIDFKALADNLARYFSSFENLDQTKFNLQFLNLINKHINPYYKDSYEITLPDKTGSFNIQIAMLAILKAKRLYVPSNLPYNTDAEKISKLTKDLKNTFDSNVKQTIAEIFSIIGFDLSLKMNALRMPTIAMLERAINLYKDLQLEFETALNLGYQASSYEQTGDYKLAKINLEESLSILKKDLENEVKLQLYASHFTKLAEIQHRFGELEFAKSSYLEALKVEEELNNVYHVSTLYYNLGKVEFDLGNLNEAQEKFTSAPNHPNVDAISGSLDPIIIESWCLPYLMKIKILQGNRQDALNMLEKFDEKKLKFENSNYGNSKKIVNKNYKIAKAELLKTSIRRKDKYQAELLYEELLNAPLDYDDYIIALKGKSELLIDEIRALEKPEPTLLEELHSCVSQLELTGSENNLIPLLVEVKILKAKVMILKRKFVDAVKLLKEGKSLAKDYDLSLILQKLQGEEHLIHSIFTDWEVLVRNEDISTSISKDIFTIYIRKALRLSSKLVEEI